MYERVTAVHNINLCYRETDSDKNQHSDGDGCLPLENILNAFGMKTIFW